MITTIQIVEIEIENLKRLGVIPMSETKERKWACGCHEVEGQLVAECTQSRPQGEVSSAQHANAKPFSPKCHRLAPPVEVEAPKTIHVPVPEGDHNLEVAALEAHEPVQDVADNAQTQVTTSDAPEQLDAPEPSPSPVASGSTQEEQSDGDTARPTRKRK